MTETESDERKAEKKEHAQFLKGIMLGALLSLLGNGMVSSFFAIGKVSPEMASATFIIGAIGFAYIIYSMDKKIKNYTK
jgi:hypothetical protein